MTMIDLEQLKIVTEVDNPPPAAIEQARAAHTLDWHALAETLVAVDLIAEGEAARKTGAVSKTIGSDARDRFFRRVNRLRAAGVDEDDVLTFGQSYSQASNRALEDMRDALSPGVTPPPPRQPSRFIGVDPSTLSPLQRARYEKKMRSGKL